MRCLRFDERGRPLCAGGVICGGFGDPNDARRRSQGIDYRQLPPQRCWAFADFVQTLGQLLGRRGGLSAFSSDELEALSKVYARVDCNESLLRQAVEQSREKTIPAIAFQLQRLSDAS